MILTIVSGFMVLLPLVVGSYMRYVLNAASGIDVAATIVLYVVEIVVLYMIKYRGMGE